MQLLEKLTKLQFCTYNCIVYSISIVKAMELRKKKQYSFINRFHLPRVYSKKYSKTYKNKKLSYQQKNSVLDPFPLKHVKL